MGLWVFSRLIWAASYRVHGLLVLLPLNHVKVPLFTSKGHTNLDILDITVFMLIKCYIDLI